MGTIGLYRFAATLLLVCAPACAQLQTQLQIVGNLPKGYLIWTFDDGPDEYVYSMFGQPTNQSLDIATLLADSVANLTGQKISGWFFQNPCHYQGAPTPNPHSANCAAPDFGNIPWSLLAQIVALGHGVGNHGEEDHVPALGHLERGCSDLSALGRRDSRRGRVAAPRPHSPSTRRGRAFTDRRASPGMPTLRAC